MKQWKWPDDEVYRYWHLQDHAQTIADFVMNDLVAADKIISMPHPGLLLAGDFEVYLKNNKCN